MHENRSNFTIKNGLLRSKNLTYIVIIIFTILVMVSSVGSQKVYASGDYMYFPNNVVYVSEGVGIYQLCIEREMQNLNSITASYRLNGGTASPFADYFWAMGNLTITGPGPSYLSINIREDYLVEADETFTAVLSGSYALNDPANGQYTTCTIIIVDNDGVVPLSDNNYLDSLMVSTGELSPVFSSSQLNYSASVSSEITEIEILALIQDSTAIMEINGIDCNSDEWSQDIPLIQGANTIQIEVEAENGDLRTYNVEIYRDILPVCSMTNSILTNGNGNILAIDKYISFTLKHTIDIEDTSEAAYGWDLNLILA